MECLSSLWRSIAYYWYRSTTIIAAFFHVYWLPAEKVERFMESYVIYDHDWADAEAMVQAFGPNYKDVVQQKLMDYYSVLNWLLALGQVEKMYIPPTMDPTQDIVTNQNLFESRMFSDLGINEKHNVLDIGCGRGRISAHCGTTTNARVTGINVDPNQLASAREYAQQCSLNKLQFARWDINDLPFPFEDNTFDSIYQVQVFSLAKDLPSLFRELYRIIKPGGRIGCLDWLHFDAYDKHNPHHQDLMRKIKPLIGAVGTPSRDQFVSAMQQAGFTILTSEVPSVNERQDALIEQADAYYTRLQRWLNFLVAWKILPSHFKVLMDRLTKDGESLVEADRMGLITMTYYVVGEKPLLDV